MEGGLRGTGKSGESSGGEGDAMWGTTCGNIISEHGAANSGCSGLARPTVSRGFSPSGSGWSVFVQPRPPISRVP
eukprot:2342486-Pyramimonas_sp.AAC.1